MDVVVRPPSFTEILTRASRGMFAGVLATALTFYAVYTLHWPMLVDSPVMHYVVLLMRHGLRPYRDITDNNMPGTYLLERGAMLVFGGGDLGWRIYDYFLEAALIASMVVIAWPYDWLAGLFAAGLFALRHGNEGAWFAAEREQEMTVLLAAACACLFLAVRRKSPGWAAGFGLLAGMAAWIKPTLLPFGLLSLGLLGYALRRRQMRGTPYLLLGLAGFLAALAASVLFLLQAHALGAFVFVLRTVTPVYVALNHPGWRFMVDHMLPVELLPLAGLGLLALLLRRQWNWEKTVLLLAVANGLLSYFLQQKGFFHHRYIFLAFFLLLLSMEIIPCDRRWSIKWLGCAALLYATVFVIPTYVQALRFLPTTSELTSTMESDLRRLGGQQLQGEVQCFDLTFGCLNSLYHLGLVENAGFTGDLLLFPYKQNSATDYYRQWFWRAQAQHPAGVLVITNQEFGAGNSFDRLSRWPEFDSYLDRNYSLAVARSFPFEDRYKGQAAVAASAAPAYRIYTRNGESFGPKGVPQPTLK